MTTHNFQMVLLCLALVLCAVTSAHQQPPQTRAFNGPIGVKQQQQGRQGSGVANMQLVHGPLVASASNKSEVKQKQEVKQEQQLAYNGRYGTKCVGEVERGYSVLQRGPPPAYLETRLVLVLQCQSQETSLQLQGPPLTPASYNVRLAYHCNEPACTHGKFITSLGEMKVRAGLEPPMKLRSSLDWDELDRGTDYFLLLLRGGDTAYSGGFVWNY